MRAVTLLLGALVVPQLVSAQSRYDPLTEIGQVDSVWSPTLEEYRSYLVYTPPGYDAAASVGQEYAVLYLLDGDAHFHSVSGLIQILGTGVNGAFVVPEMIVVAIPNTDRTRDLTPTHSLVGNDGTAVPAFESSGGNDAFFGFLREELIPRIDSLYATSPYRMLVGHSFGGITALNALYTTPETFDAYVAIDPSLWWDNEVLLHRARSFFTSTDLGGKALYVAQANTIDPDRTDGSGHFNAISRFNEVMRAYDESGIRYAFRYYDDDDHGSVPLIAEYDALRFVFDGYRLPLRRVMEDPTFLARHFRGLATVLGPDPTPPLRVVRLLASATLAQDTANALAFADIGEGLYPDDHNWSELHGDVAAARGQIDAARAHYEEALSKSDNADHVQEKLAGLGRRR